MIKTEVIKLEVSIRIKYDDTDKKNRREAVRMAKTNFMEIGSSNYEVRPIKAKLIKPSCQE